MRLKSNLLHLIFRLKGTPQEHLRAQQAEGRYFVLLSLRSS
jgi:hypothetical protein